LTITYSDLLARIGLLASATLSPEVVKQAVRSVVIKRYEELAKKMKSREKKERRRGRRRR